MTTQSNAMPASPFESQLISPELNTAVRTMYWSVRRELWENRSVYIAPLAAAAVTLFGFLISLTRLPHKLRSLSGLDPMQQHKLIEQPYVFAEGLIMGTTFIVAIFYCLDALHGERRDRSILFWKSLPVSDLTTVLSKASIPLVILPLLTFGITVATHTIMLLLSNAVTLGTHHELGTPMLHLSLYPMWMMLLYHLVAMHSLWYAPFFGWMLLVSAWARRAPFLWAALPPLAIGVVEKIAFNTTHFAALLANRFSGGAEGASFIPYSMSMDPLTHLDPGRFLISPGLWLGLAVTAAFLAAAARLRRNREPI